MAVLTAFLQGQNGADVVDRGGPRWVADRADDNENYILINNAPIAPRVQNESVQRSAPMAVDPIPSTSAGIRNEPDSDIDMEAFESFEENESLSLKKVIESEIEISPGRLSLGVISSDDDDEDFVVPTKAAKKGKAAAKGKTTKGGAKAKKKSSSKSEDSEAVTADETDGGGVTQRRSTRRKKADQ